MDSRPLPSPTPALPPGPKDSRVIQTWRFAMRPQASLDDYFREFGDAVTVRMFGFPPIALFSGTAEIQDLFLADPTAALAGESNARLFEAFLGKHPLINLDGERHRRRRKLLMPPFHGRRVQVYGSIMRAVTRDVMARWPVGRPFPMHQEMQAISLEVILRLIFGLDDPAHRSSMTRAILHYLEVSYRPEAGLLAIPAARIDLGPRSPWGRVVRGRRVIHEQIMASIARRRAQGPGDHNDVLSLLLDARDEDGDGLRDDELRDELFTLLLVGHETTATTLTWAWWCILQRPEVMEAIRAEGRRVSGDGPLDHVSLEELPYLDAVISEAARLHPVTDGIAREIKRPLRIGRYLLPTGTMAAVSAYLAHRNPASWPKPDQFVPERFLDQRPSPYAFVPFGGGSRRCLGAAFAMSEMKIIVSEVLARADLKLRPGYAPKAIRRAVAIAPSEGVPVVLERRRSPAEAPAI